MFSAKAFIEANGGAAALEKLVHEAYLAGFTAGIEQVSRAAAQQVHHLKANSVSTGAPDLGRPTLNSFRRDSSPLLVVRATRGAVRDAVQEIIGQHPGLTIVEYEKIAAEKAPHVAKKSIGNELRRGEGTLYERNVPGGNLWFPKGQKNEAAVGDHQPAASLFHTSRKGGEAHEATTAI